MYDIEAIVTAEVQRFLESVEYRACCEAVCDYVQDEFPEACIPDNLNFQDSPSLNPPPQRMKELKRHYRRQSELIFGTAPSFEEIMERIFKFRSQL